MTRPRTILLAAASALAGALAVLACVDVRTVQLTFGDSGEGLDGFFCRDDAGAPLLLRTLNGGVGFKRVNFVVDFVDLSGGVPGCRGAQIIAWCAEHECAPLQRRVCIPYDPPSTLSLPTNNVPAARAALRDAIFGDGGALDGAGVTDDAPDGTLILRVVSTVESCEPLLVWSGSGYPAFDPQQLIGCAYSSPVSLGVARGEVFLGFEQAAVFCTDDHVASCANALSSF